MTFHLCIPIWFAHHDDPIAHYPSFCWVPSYPQSLLLSCHDYIYKSRFHDWEWTYGSHPSVPSPITLPSPLLSLDHFSPSIVLLLLCHSNLSTHIYSTYSCII